MAIYNEKSYLGVGQCNASAAYAADRVPVPGSRMTQIEERFASLIQNLAHEGEKLQGIVDRVVGSEPQKESAATPRPVPNGKLALLEAAMDEAMNRLARISILSDRLNSVF